ncbi:MAG: division/cell wall cluster transcriptional repressor MraZ [Erysipelotrichaceae bacterium]|nr:division/cell wall cluster transcriptional repressor MraZ [Erysipelotrichaceae bacterium]
MFFGTYRHNIDAKGRVSIPAKLRNQCGDKVYVMKGHDGCLDVYSESGWEEEYATLLKLSKKKKKSRAYRRIVTAGISDLTFDKMGRILLSSDLRDLAKLNKEVVINGAVDHIEIWDPETWDAYYNEYIEHFDDLSEELEDGDEDDD